MKKLKNIGVLISLVLVLLLALGAASAADDAIIDDADLASIDDVQAVDNAQTTDEINAESTDIIVTDTGDSGDSDMISDGTGLQEISDNGDEAVVSDNVNPKNALKAEASDEPLRAEGDGTFSDLNTLISNAAAGSTITLDRNYVYNPDTDYDNYRNGITISKSLVINGNGFTIDGQGIARVFILPGPSQYYGYSYTFNDINFVNAYTNTAAGAAITSQNSPNTVTISNCNFTNNSAQRGAVYISVGNYALETGRVTITGCVFKENYASDRGGAIYSGISRSNGFLTVNNCVFIDNTAYGVGQAIYYAGGNYINVNYNWWGQNEWNNRLVANSNNNYITPRYSYQAVLSQTGANTAELALKLNGSTVPAGSSLPARDATFSIGSGSISPESATLQGSVVATYGTLEDTTIMAIVDYQLLTLDVYKTPKENINQLDVTVQNVILPGVAEIVVDSDVSGTFDVTIGEETKEITLTDGHGTLPWDALPEGSYFVVVSRTNDPVYNDKVAYTSFKVEKADVSISISASDNEIEYGETVTITPTITPDTITANDITYYVDGTAVSSAALSDLSVGTHTVVAKYAGDENYKADESNVVIIKVSKATPVISVTGDTKTFPEDVVIGLTFTGVNNAALPGATIRVTVNGVTYAVVTDDEGKASLTIKGLAVGNYDIVAESIANESYEATSNSAEKVVVTNAAITVSGEGDSVTYPEKGIIIINTNVAGAYTIKIGDKTYENVALLAGENSFEVKDVFNVGTYDIKVSANINNYDELVDEFIATYTVSPRTVFIEVDTFGGVDFGGEGEIEVRLYDAGTDERIKDNVTLIFTDANGNVLETTTVETIVGPWERGDKLDFTADWPMGDYYVTVENPNYIFVEYDDSEYKFTSFGDEAGEIEYSTGTVVEIENDLDIWIIKVRVLTNDADESYVGNEYYIDTDAYFDTEQTYELMLYDGENLIGTGIWVLISKEIIPLNPPKYDYPVHKVGIGVELVSGDGGYIFGYEHEVVLKLVKYGEEDDEGEPVEINCPATIVVLKFNGETEEWEEIATIDDLSFANGRISIDCTDFKPGEYKLKVSISDETYEIRMWNEEADSDVDYRIFWEEGSLFQVDNDHVYIENVIGEESTRFGDEHDFSFEVWHSQELFAHDFDATVKVYKWNDDTEEYDLVETIPVEISGGKIQAIDFSKLKVGRYKVTVKLDDPNYSFEEWDDDIGADVDYAMRYFEIYQDNIHANVEGRDWTQYGQDRIFKFDLTHWDDEVNEDVLFVYDTNAIVKVYKLTWDDEGTESAELINTYSVAITGGHSEAIDLSDLNAGSYRVTIQLEDEDYELDYWFNDQYGIQEERFDVDKANVDMTVVFDKPEGYVYGDDVTVIVTVTPQTTDEKLNEVIELNIMGKESQRKTLENGVARFTLDGYDAGLYTIWVNFFGTENYHDQYNYIAGFDIVKANPEINVIPKKDEYAYGEDVVIEVTLKDGETGLTATAIVNLDGTDYLVNINEGTGTVVVKGLTVGEYPITANVAGTDNYNAVSYEGDAKAVVTKGDLTIVAQTSDPSVQYGEEIIFSYTLNAPEGAVTTGNVKYYVDGNQITGDRISSLGIGTHTLVAEYTGDPNFNDVSSTQVSFTVTKADPVLVISANATEIKYPESIKLSGTITPEDATGSIVYYLDGTPIDGDVLARIAPGVYTVTAKYGGNDNYNEVDSSNSLEITVAKGDVSIEVTAGAYTIGYGDDLFISRILNPADASVAVTYIVDGEEVDYQLISGLSAGTHTIAAKASESVYYNGAISETKVVTVTKAAADVTVTTDPVTYPNVATVVVNSNVPGTYTIRVGNKDYAVVVGDTGSGSVVIDKLEPGTYDVVLSADLGGNYESVVQIPAASLTVNAQTGPFVVSSNGLGYATLAEALAVAQAAGDTITVVEAGTYTGEGNIGVTIDKDVIIKAGEGLDVIFDAAKADTNILTIAKDHAVTLSGLAFTGVDNTNTKFGAVVNHGQLTVTDCEFYDNLVHVAGTGGSNGAAAIFSATDATGLTITGSTFTNNKAVSPDFNTGGIGAVASWATSGEVLIKDSVFESNEARYGGAVEFENLNQMTPAVLGCNFTNNIAYIGAGINFNDGCKLEQVTNCTFTGNTIRGPQGAPTTGSMGAAICAGHYRADSVLMVDGCKFIENKGDLSDGSSGGAIRVADRASAIIINSEFVGNEARLGSAISIGTLRNDTAYLIVDNCNFTDNKATMYGAISIDCEPVTATITESTFSGNTAPENRNIFNMGTIEAARNTFDINETSIEVNNIPYGQDEVINGTFDAGVNYDLTGSTVSLTINGADVTATVTEGNKFTTTVTKPDVGTHPVVFNKVTDSDSNVYIPENPVETSFTVEKVAVVVTVTAEDVTYPTQATVVVNANIPGTYTIRVGNKDYAVVVGDTGSGSQVIDLLEPGTYEVILTADLGPNYDPVVQVPACSFTVAKATPIVEVNDTSAEWNTPVSIPVKVTDADGKPISGTVIVTVNWEVDGVTQVVELDENGEGTANFVIDQALGDLTVTAKFIGNDNYTAAQDTAVLAITNSTDANIEAAADPVTFGEDSFIDVVVTDGRGAVLDVAKVNVTIDGETKELDVVDGKVNIGKLPVGDTPVTVSYVDESHKLATADVTVTVNPASGVQLEAVADNYTFGAGGKLNITVTDVDGNKLNGTVGIEVDGELLDPAAVVTDGFVSIDLAGHAVGEHTVYVTFYNESYLPADIITHFTVAKASPIVEVNDTSAEWNTPVSIPVKVTDADGKPISGTVIVTVDWEVDGVTQVVELDENGEGTANFVIDQALGDLTITARFIETDNYTAAQDTAVLSISESSDASIEAAADPVTFGEDSFIDVVVTDGRGAVLDVAKVNVTIDGETKELDVVDGKVNIGKLPVGDTPVTVSYVDESHKLATADVTVTVNPASGVQLEAVADNYTFGAGGKLNITVTDVDGNKLNGTVGIEVDGELLDPAAVVTDGFVSIDLAGHAVGEHTVYVTFYNESYLPADIITHFTVTKASPTVTITPTKDAYAYGEDVVLDVTVKDGETGLTGTVVVTINNVNYAVDVTDGTGQLTVKGLANGNYAVTGKFLGNDDYEAADAPATSVVVSASTDATMEVSANDPTYGEDAIITVTLTDGEGNPITVEKVNVTIDGETQEFDVVDGKVTIPNLPAGDTPVTVSYTDDVYGTVAKDLTVSVDPASGVQVDAVATGYAVGSTGKLDITVADADGNKLDGTARIEIDGELVDAAAAVTGGVLSIDLSGHAVGQHDVYVVFSNDNYLPANAITHFIVTKATNATVTVTSTKESYAYGEDVILDVTVKDGETGLTGTVVVTVDGVGYAVDVTDGTGQLTVKGLANNTYPVTAKFLGNDNYEGADAEAVSVVVNGTTDAVITATVSEPSVDGEATLSVNVVDGAGNPVTGKVNVTVGDGEAQEYDVTDGVASIPLSGLALGENTIVVSTNEYTADPVTLTAVVPPKNTADLTVGTDGENITIEAKDGTTPLNGTATVVIDGGEPITVPIDETGKAVIPMDDLAPGQHTVEVTFANDNYEPVSEVATITVPKGTVSVTITPTKDAYDFGEDVVLDFTVKDGETGVTGTVVVTVDGVNYAIDVTSGTGQLTVKGLASGTYEATADFIATDDYDAASAAPANVVVNAPIPKPIPVVTIVASKESYDFGEDVVLDVTVKDGETGVTGTVVVTVDGVEYLVDVSGGSGQLTVKGLINGDYEASADFIANDEYDAASAAEPAKFTVDAPIPVIQVDIVVTAEPDQVIIKLIDENGNPVEGKAIVAIDGVSQEVNVSGGIATIPASAGYHNISVVYEGDDTHAGTAVMKDIVVVLPQKIGTIMTISRSKTLTYNSTLDNRSDYLIYATLTDEYGNPLANKQVSLAAHGGIYNMTTNSKGQVRFYVAHSVKGVCTQALSFLGDEKYDASFVATNVEIEAQNVKFAVAKKTYKATAKTKSITATLKNSKGKALAGKKVVFTVNGKKYTATTNSKGVATVKVSISKKGTYKVSATFAGDKTYKKATRTNTLVIK